MLYLRRHIDRNVLYLPYIARSGRGKTRSADLEILIEEGGDLLLYNLGKA